MSELTPAAPARTVGPDAVDGELLARTLTEAVSAVPGVLRIEPTLAGAMRSLVRSGSGPGRLVDVSARGRLVDVSVSIATGSDHQARAVAHQIRSVVLAQVAALDAEIGDLSVCVLSVDVVDEVGATAP